MRVSDYIVKFLKEYGVKDFFYLPGGGMMHLTDGLACNKDIKHYCLHHEQAIAMAVESYARTTEHFGVGYFTTGPGATNAVTGVAGAWLDSVPCMYISGQAKRKEATYSVKLPGIRQIGVQEINIIPIVESITKYTGFIDDPNDVKYHLQKAIYLAKQGRPGPVWLDVPLDVQGAPIDEKNLREFVPPEQEVSLQQKDLQTIIDLLKTAQRPVIVAGQGIRLAGALNEFMSFVDTFKIPVITSYLGVDVIDSYHPQSIGRIGVKGDRAGNLAMQNADLLLVLGCSMPVSNTGYDPSQFAREAKIVVVDIDLSSHQKNTMPKDYLIQADAKELLTSLLKEVKEVGNEESWWKHCLDTKTKYPVSLPEYGEMKDKVNMYYFFDKLSDAMTNTDVVVTDAGSSFYVGSQATKVKQGARYITSGGLSTMGYSLPASIGVSIANNNGRVMCVTGDGSLQQNIQEIQSVVHYKLPIKIFVLNNDGYLSMRFTQGKYFEKRYMGATTDSGISFPDSEKISKAYGIKFIRIHNNKELEEELPKIIDSPEPILVDIMVPPDQLVIPTVASEKKPDGTMVSKPLEDMFPFLPRDEFNANMRITPLDESK